MIDGMIVREMGRRCNYDPIKIKKLKRLLLLEPIKQVEIEPTNKNMMVIKLWEHYLETNYLSARIFDYLTASNLQLVDIQVIQELIDSLPSKPFQVISIHDMFRCLPNYGNDLRIQYNLQLYLLAKSNLLSNVLKQILGTDVIVTKNKYNLDEILNTEYALS